MKAYELASHNPRFRLVYGLSGDIATGVTFALRVY